MPKSRFESIAVKDKAAVKKALKNVSGSKATPKAKPKQTRSKGVAVGKKPTARKVSRTTSAGQRSKSRSAKHNSR